MFLGQNALAEDDEIDTLILRPIVQEYPTDNYMELYPIDGRLFVSVNQLAQNIGFNIKQNGKVHGFFGTEDKPYEINFQTKTASYDARVINFVREDVKEIDNMVHFDIKFLEELFGISADINYLNMTLMISSPEKLPWTIKEEAKKKRSRAYGLKGYDTFKDYNFDERLFSFPVADLSLTKRWNKTNIGKENEKTYNSDAYSINLAMLAFGMDANVYLAGDFYQENYSPSARMMLSRTYLEEPSNRFNLKKIQMGDVAGYESSLFSNSKSGRGVEVSSFKDLVTSADKTIDINGYLETGWEVELYLNSQLVAFRQQPVDGRYDFKDIPVNYGLNDFRLVFYGPYGEIREESRRYYSGTSPVKKGEFGYVANAYQADRYIVEKDTDFASEHDTPTVNMTGYYGLSDAVNVSAGYSSVQDVIDPEKTKNFGMFGAQTVFDGASFQYNLMYNMDNSKMGHNFEVQGNVHIGDVFARYTHYGDLEAPAGYMYGDYLKSLFEGRFSGSMKWINMPYFINYQLQKNHKNEENESVAVRVSPLSYGAYNLTLEDQWQSNFGNYTKATNDVSAIFNTFYNKWGVNLYTTYRTSPESYMKETGAKVDYRLDRNTYVYFQLKRDYRSSYMKNMKDLDTLTVSGSKVFPIGGLTFDISTSSDKDFAVMLRYNMSFGKKPKSNRYFANAEARLSDTAVIYAKAVDENEEPLEGIKVFVGGIEKPVETDEAGEAIITNITPYSKSIISVDVSSVGDIALVPEFEEEKRVFRPGSVYPLYIPFVHKAAVEGQLVHDDLSLGLAGYKIEAINKEGESVLETYSDREGLFILDGVPYGVYTILISLYGEEAIRFEDVVIDDYVYLFEDPIEIPEMYKPNLFDD